jgi:hypothetical protein
MRIKHQFGISAAVLTLAVTFILASSASAANYKTIYRFPSATSRLRRTNPAVEADGFRLADLFGRSPVRDSQSHSAAA